MKRNTRFLAFALCALATTGGCGSKTSQTAAPASTASNPPAEKATAAPPSNAVQPPGGQGTEEEASSGNAAQTPSKPSFPSFGGTVTPGSPSANAGNAPPQRPSLSVGGGGAVGGQPGFGGPSLGNTGGGSAMPPVGFEGNPGSNTGIAGAPPAAPPPNNNPFQDPSNFLPPTLSLRDRAVNAFKGGNLPRAYALYQSHLLSLPNEEREAEMSSYRWDKKRVVPRLGYSFAMGVILNNTSRQDNLRPIGTKKAELSAGPPGSSGPGGGFGGGGPGGESGFPGGPAGLGFGNPGAAGGVNSGQKKLPKDLTDAAGKYASTFVDEFGKAHSDGKWSEAFHDYEYGAPMTSLPMPTGLAGNTMPPGGGQAGGQAGIPGFSAGGPPAGYNGGPGAGGPPGFGGPGGPPAGYTGGPGAGTPPGLRGGGGPPAGYNGGPAAGGAPPGFGVPGAGPGAGAGAAGGGSGSNINSPFRFLRPDPQDGGAGFDEAPTGVPGAANPNAPGFGAPGPGRPGFGGPGLGGPGLGGPGFGQQNTMQAPVDPTLAKDLELPSDTFPLTSGLNYIGKGDSVGELSKRAIEQNYDALIVFEVDVSLLRVNNTIKNDCKIRVINLRAEKDSKEKLIVGTSLNNQEVANDKDPDSKIEKAVDILLKKMYEAYPLEDLPNFKTESITNKRLKDLVNDKVRSKLDLLAEVELYASKGLVDDTLKLAAFERIAGADGKTLATSTPEDRIEMLEKLLKRQFD